MPLPYQAILRLPAEADAVAIAEQEMEKWLLRKADHERRDRVRSGAFFQPGVHQVADRKTLTVVHADRAEDGSRRRRLNLVEGDWEASLTAIDYPAGNRRQDALVITAGMVDAPNGDWEADPPRFVKDLLARETIYDGAAHVTSDPRAVGPDEVDDVLAAVIDRTRSVSVIVATSLGSEYDTELRARVARLTAKVIGVASVYFIADDAIEPLNSLLGLAHGVPAGRIRTFLPLVDLEDEVDARRHRVLGPATFARAIRGRDVSPGLKSAFALETRAALLSRPLPSDLRRGFEALDIALSQTRQEVRIRSRVQDRLALGSTASVPSPGTVAATLPVPQPGADDPSAASLAGLSSSRRVLKRFEALVQRWLKTTGPVSESNVDGLELHLTEQLATADVLREAAAASELRFRDVEARAAEYREERDNLDLELAIVDEEVVALRRQIGALQSRLKDAKVFDGLYEPPAATSEWETPQSLLELATLLKADSEHKHFAFERVEFTGEMRAVEAIQKRDLVGRYAAAFWEFVHTLYDYTSARDEGRFDGNVHQYLLSDAIGHKCSPQRHAAKESESVLSNAAWRRQRMLPVPFAVDRSKEILMEAHFRPTHADTVAPRMHYFDDTSSSGKIYIGYIGRHLENTKTKNA